MDGREGLICREIQEAGNEAARVGYGVRNFTSGCLFFFPSVNKK